jgi:16S rRNA (uracil1498-N3)-methyltransferase
VSDRFHCPAPPRDGRYHLSPEESRHLSRVCRLGVGDRVEIFDGRGFATGAKVVAATGDSVVLVAVGEPLPIRDSPFSLVLATAVPKGDRLDWIVDKATELGVDRLIPIIAERSVVVPRGSKLERLRRSIIEASKQCRRARLMRLEEPLEWPRLVDSFPSALTFLADPGGSPPAHWPMIPPGREVVLAVGPEGGLSGAEIELAIRAGWTAIRLGCNTLRIETAGLAGCAILLARVAEGGE